MIARTSCDEQCKHLARILLSLRPYPRLYARQTGSKVEVYCLPRSTSLEHADGELQEFLLHDEEIDGFLGYRCSVVPLQGRVCWSSVS